MSLSEIKNILIVRLSSLGDILLSTPMIRSIKKENPAIKLDFVVREEYKELLSENPYIDNLYTLKREGGSQRALRNILKEKKYDIIADLQNNLRSRIITSGIDGRKFRFKKLRLAKLLLVHYKRNLLRDTPPIPVRYANTIPDLLLDEKGLELFSKKTASPVLTIDKKYIGLCPGSRHFTKMWPKGYFIDLGKKLRDAGYTTVLFGGKSDIEICKEISKEVEGSINLCTGNEIMQTVSDMKECRVIVCNDSGLMHAACSAGVAVLAIFGSTVTEFGFAPYNNKNVILQNKLLYCRPCSHIGRANCPEGHFKCMLELTPESALEKINQLLDV